MNNLIFFYWMFLVTFRIYIITVLLEYNQFDHWLKPCVEVIFKLSLNFENALCLNLPQGNDRCSQSKIWPEETTDIFHLHSWSFLSATALIFLKENHYFYPLIHATFVEIHIPLRCVHITSHIYIFIWTVSCSQVPFPTPSKRKQPEKISPLKQNHVCGWNCGVKWGVRKNFYGRAPPSPPPPPLFRI